MQDCSETVKALSQPSYDQFQSACNSIFGESHALTKSLKTGLLYFISNLTKSLEKRALQIVVGDLSACRIENCAALISSKWLHDCSATT